MADLARIKRNVAKMASMNAPEADIDGYIASEGVTVEDVRNYKPVQDVEKIKPKEEPQTSVLGKLGTIDRGVTLGLGRKAGGLINAIGTYPINRIAQLAGVKNTPSFWDEYHAVVDPTMQAIEEYHKDKPIEALGLELGASVVNPINKIGVGFIGRGKGLLGKALRSAGVGGVIGSAAGATNTENAEYVAPNTAAGGLGGAILGGALPVAANRVGATYNALKSIIAPKASVAGKATGLQNIVKDNDSVRALKRGIMASDDVAKQVLSEAPREMGRLNEQMADVLNKTTGRKLNIEGAERNALEDYRNYIGRNADYPVYTTEEPVKEPSMFELLVNNRAYNKLENQAQKEQGKSLLAFLKSKGGIRNTGGELTGRDLHIGYPGLVNNKGLSLDDAALYAYEHGYLPGEVDYSGEMGRPSINKLLEAIDDEMHGIKRYSEQETSNAFAGLKNQQDRVDQLAEEMDMLGIDYSKMTAKEAENAYNNAVSDWSRQNSEIPVMPFAEDTQASRKLGTPYIGDILGGLNDFKREALETALNKGAKMSDYAKGTLDSAHKAQEVLNDMINASYDTTNPLKPKATTETNQLMELKKVFNNILEPSGVKPLDARISKAKSLQYFYDMGYKFKPSEKKFEDLGIKKLRDRQAFLQGRLKAITDNVKDDKNLAKAIKADENTLEKVMPKKNFEELMRNVNRINREYTRLNKFEQLADREIDKPMAAGRPLEEAVDFGRVTAAARAIDRLNAILWRGANTKRAQALLNGGAVNPSWLAAIENAGQADVSKLTPYLAQYMVNQ